MLFPKLIVAAASLPFLARGMPASEFPGLEVLEQFTKDDGALIITVYGDADWSSPSRRDSAAGLERRCGSNQVTCDNEHLADRNACVSLVNALDGDQAELQGSPRSICGTYSGKKCCVSWHNPASGAVRASLVPPAQAILNQCKGDTGVSGKTSDSLLGQTCTNLCVSNREKGC